MTASRELDRLRSMSWWTLVTLWRLLPAPALLALAFLGRAEACAAVLGLSLAASVAAGKRTPAPGRASPWTVHLDGWASLATHASVPLCAYWLSPELPQRDPVTFWALAGALAAPASFAFIKYGALTGYRGRAAVVAVHVVSAAAVVLFAGGPFWPLRLATALLVLAALEDVAIIAALPQPTTAARSLPVAMRLRRDRFADLDE